MFKLLKVFEGLRPFTEAEAWMLFRLAAWAEAVGWTLLISGMTISDYLTPGNRTAVIIAGQLHGTLFFIYLAACTVLYPSLGWRRHKALIALAFSVPPYGSLAFELWAGHKRHAHGFKNYRSYLAYCVLIGA